jgi:predicted amidophosphoribosyltransferase
MTTFTDRYPIAGLRASLLDAWAGDDYAMLSYRPKRLTGGVYDAASQLLIDFKEGLTTAEDLMTELARGAIQRQVRELRDRRRCAYLVVVPSHAATTTDGPCHRLGRRLSAGVDWLEFLPGLVRHATVAKSSKARPGERPTRADHVASIRYEGPRLRIPSQSIIMLDDVITAGETSGAVREILLQATGCRSVIGLFLSRTVPS